MAPKFKPWGTPDIVKTGKKYGDDELWVYRSKGVVSIKSMSHDNSCVVLSPKTIKKLIGLLKETLK